MKIKKSMLISVFNFLAGASLVGPASRARTKLVNDISEQIDILQNDQKDLVQSNGGHIDDAGNIKFSEAESKVEYEKQKEELFKEKVLFNEKTEGYFERLRVGLDKYTEKLSGQDAVAYDYLLDKLEE